MEPAFCIATYDWVSTHAAEEYAQLVPGVLRQGGLTRMPVTVVSGKKKVVQQDLFGGVNWQVAHEIEGFSTGSSTFGISYINDANRDFKFFCLTSDTAHNSIEQMEHLLIQLCKANAAGYSIGFRADSAQAGLYYGLGITAGLPSSHYERLRSVQLARFFKETAKKLPAERVYNKDKIRALYEFNIVNDSQFRRICNHLLTQGVELPTNSCTGVGQMTAIRLTAEEAAAFTERLIDSDLMI